MPTSKICDVEPFRYQATPQIGDTNASAGQINDQFLEDYLNRLRQAICDDITSIIEECCNGGGGGATTFLALTDTPASYAGAGGDFVAVNAGATGLEFVAAPSGGTSGLHLNYSTSEQATNRTWIDGRTIYQKTIDFGALPNTTSKSVAHNITSLDFCIAWEAIAYDTTGGAAGNTEYPLAAANTAALANQIQIQIDTTGANVNIRTGTNRSTFYGYITLFYVKVP
jgi:hypothetical protein